MESNRHMNCKLRVDTHSSGWEKSLMKVIKRVKGVSYSIDAAHGVVYISGEIDPNKLLTHIARARKHAELIHADCGGEHSHSSYGNGKGSRHGYGYYYDAGYGKLEPHPYPYHEVQPGLAYTHFDPYPYYGLPAPEAERVHAPPLAPPSAPPQEFHPPSHTHYDPHNSSCYIM